MTISMSMGDFSFILDYEERRVGGISGHEGLPFQVAETNRFNIRTRYRGTRLSDFNYTIARTLNREDLRNMFREFTNFILRQDVLRQSNFEGHSTLEMLDPTTERIIVHHHV